MLHTFRRKFSYQKGTVALLLGMAVLGNPSTPGHGFKNPLSTTCNIKSNFSTIIDYIANGTTLDKKYNKCDWVKKPKSASNTIKDLVIADKVDKSTFCGFYNAPNSKLKAIFTSDQQARLSFKCPMEKE